MASVQQAVVTEFNIGEWFVQDCPALHLLLKKLGGKTFELKSIEVTIMSPGRVHQAHHVGVNGLLGGVQLL